MKGIRNGQGYVLRWKVSLPISLPTHPNSYITDIRGRYNEILAIFLWILAVLLFFFLLRVHLSLGY
jgi:hypothetical protein